MNNEEQRSLATILDLFAERFGKHAILRGGLVLKVLGSARYTNDLDYVFVPYGSKNDVVHKVIQTLQSIPGVTTTYSLNSKCLRVVVRNKSCSIQIKAKVASTVLYSPQFYLAKRLIHIVDHSVSLANKLAAWNERRAHKGSV